MKKYLILFCVLCPIIAWQQMPVALAQESSPIEIKITDISPALVQKADVVVDALIRKPKQQEDGTLYPFARHSGGDFVKGPQGIAARQLFLPNGSSFTFGDSREWIVFARADLDNKRNVVFAALDAQSLGREETKKLCEQIRDIVQKQQKLSISMTTDKPSYTCGEPVTMVWQIKNITEKPVVIYIGPFAFQQGITIDNMTGGSSIGGSQTRTAADYKMLAPGESYEKQMIFKRLFPEGEIGVTMRYVAEDNWAQDKDRVRSRIPGVVFVHKEIKFTVPIEPLPTAAMKAAIAKLSSPIWATQLEAMQLLSISKAGAAQPEVEAMANHPWPSIRKLAADALTLNRNPISPALRDLIFDPDVSVRTEARQMARNRQIPGSSLDIIALKMVKQEAIDKGFFPKEEAQSQWMFDTQLIHIRDPRIGDLMAQLLRSGQGSGLVLNILAGTYHQVRIKDEATADQKSTILKAWEEQRANVQNPYTMEQLKFEMDRCRLLAFQNFQLDDRVDEIRTLMAKLNRDFAIKDSLKDQQTLADMGATIVPTTMFILHNNYQGFDSQFLYQLYGQWKSKEALNYLLDKSYQNNEFAPLAAVNIEKETASKQLQYLFEQDSDKPHLGASIALTWLGEKQAVPVVMKYLPDMRSTWSDEVTSALTNATGQKFETSRDWVVWWQKSGSKLEWK